MRNEIEHEMKKEDRRIRKTKAMLREALTSLMQKKSIREISVKELTDLVDINRGTFYLHYRDIFDMVDQMEDELMTEFIVMLTSCLPIDSDEPPYSLLESIFQFLKDNAGLCTVLLGNNGDIVFVNKLKNFVKENCFLSWFKSKQLDDPLRFQYIYNFISSGCIGVFEAWLYGGTKESPQEMAAIITNQIAYGLSFFRNEPSVKG